MRLPLPDRRPDEFDIFLETNGMISAGRLGRLFIEMDNDIRQRLGDQTAYFEIVDISTGSLSARLRLICTEEAANAAQVGGVAIAIVAMLLSCTSGWVQSEPSDACGQAVTDLIVNDDVQRVTVTCNERTITLDRRTVMQPIEPEVNVDQFPIAVDQPIRAAEPEPGEDLQVQLKRYVGARVVLTGTITSFDRETARGTIISDKITIFGQNWADRPRINISSKGNLEFLAQQNSLREPLSINLVITGTITVSESGRVVIEMTD